MSINKIMLPRPPKKRKPKVDNNQRIKRIIAIVRKMPGSKLIIKSIRIKKRTLCKVNGLFPIEKSA